MWIWLFSLQFVEKRRIFNRIVLGDFYIFLNRIALVILHKYPRILLYSFGIYCLQFAGILKYFDTNKVLAVVVATGHWLLLTTLIETSLLCISTRVRHYFNAPFLISVDLFPRLSIKDYTGWKTNEVGHWTMLLCLTCLHFWPWELVFSRLILFLLMIINATFFFYSSQGKETISLFSLYYLEQLLLELRCTMTTRDSKSKFRLRPLWSWYCTLFHRGRVINFFLSGLD